MYVCSTFNNYMIYNIYIYIIFCYVWVMGHVFLFFSVRCRQDHCGTWRNHLTDAGPIWASGSLCYTWLVISCHVWPLLSVWQSRDCCVAKFFSASAVPGEYTWSQRKSKNINERAPIQEWPRRNGTPLCVELQSDILWHHFWQPNVWAQDTIASLPAV